MPVEEVSAALDIEENGEENNEENGGEDLEVDVVRRDGP